jgi:outer membrane protein assembly factor BamB
MRLIVALVAATALAAPVALAEAPFPDTISLPNGWQPEGIAVGDGTSFYAGSIPTGAVYEGDVRMGTGSVLVQGATGRAATGLKYDRGRLFVSGAFTGKAFVYDASTGDLIREYQLAAPGSAPFINDVAVTKDAAYFTDSSHDVIYRVPLASDGTPAQDAQTVRLTGDFQLVGGFNLNGIVATPNGKSLLAVQTNTGELFRIDPGTGATDAVELGGATLTNGDGLVLQGKTLYVVQNFDNLIAVVDLAPDLGSGTLVRTIASSSFDTPTTAARFGSRLYAVNARFSTPPTPTTTYGVVQVRR